MVPTEILAEQHFQETSDKDDRGNAASQNVVLLKSSALKDREGCA